MIRTVIEIAKRIKIRRSIGKAVDFIDDHVVVNGRWFIPTILLALLLMVIVAVTVIAFWATIITLGLLLLPAMTYYGWNWTLPTLLGAKYIGFNTAIGINLLLAVVLFFLRQIVVRIRN